jgi:hypothetical protein
MGRREGSGVVYVMRFQRQLQWACRYFLMTLSICFATTCDITARATKGTIKPNLASGAAAWQWGKRVNRAEEATHIYIQWMCRKKATQRLKQLLASDANDNWLVVSMLD